MRNSRFILCLTIFITLPCHAVGVASEVAPARSVPTRDGSVARAVAEVAATLPEPEARGDAANARPRAFDALDTLPRRCTALEATAKVALAAGCIRSQRCSPTPVPAASQSPWASCYVIRTKANG